MSRSALCYHSNKTRAPIANPLNSAQLECTLYHSPKLRLGPYSSVGMRRGTGRQTYRQKQTHRRPCAKFNKLFLQLTVHVHQQRSSHTGCRTHYQPLTCIYFAYTSVIVWERRGCCGEMSIGCALCVCVSNATRECGLIVSGCSKGGV